MDKTTKGFVIAASVVVIGCGSVFLLDFGAQLLNIFEAEKARVERLDAAQLRHAALKRRTNECRTRAIVFFGEVPVPEDWDDFRFERAEWVKRCQKESLPVEQLGRWPHTWVRPS